MTELRQPQVGEPHFDDERTVLRARPVVPLEEINAQAKRQRRWFLGGAFGAAMLLGAVVAVVSAYFTNRAVVAPAELMMQVEVPAQEQSVAVSSSEIESDEASPPKREAPTQRTTRGANHSVAAPRLDEEEESRRNREAILIEEWQERRMRRATRRERRRERLERERSERDLSNLDEIFEGSRRP